MPSLEDLQNLIDSSPADPFPRYGLAMELRRRGRVEEALAAFEKLLELFPDYIPAHQQRAMMLEAAGNTEEARRRFREGIDAARRAGDHHAAEEMQGALDALD